MINEMVVNTEYEGDEHAIEFNVIDNSVNMIAYGSSMTMSEIINVTEYGTSSRQLTYSIKVTAETALEKLLDFLHGEEAATMLWYSSSYSLELMRKSGGGVIEIRLISRTNNEHIQLGYYIPY